MSQTYFAILTAVGEAKLANAAALGTQLQISRMAVGDGGGNLPIPNRNQTALIGEQYRADLNTLQTDPANASQVIAELVIPETTGGWWIREMGLYDAAGDLVAISNCPPSYKPQMTEGSGRTQVLRMVLIVSSTAAVQLKIDPSVVLATREFVTITVNGAIATRQPLHANLTAFAGLVGAADKLPYFTGAGALSLATITAKARSLLASADEAAMRAFLQLGNAASANVQTSQLDAAAGRALIMGNSGVGPFGLGEVGVNLTDLSNLVYSGFGRVSAINTPGAPTPGAGCGIGMPHSAGMASLGGNLFLNYTTDVGGYTPTPRLFARSKISAAAFGAWLEFWNTENLKPTELSPPGAVAHFARNTAPSGWLKANGAAVSRATYAALFAAIGTTFGAGDGSTTFNLPDLRGEFLRGWDDGRGVDSGRSFGTAQGGAVESHSHTFAMSNDSGSLANSAPKVGDDGTPLGGTYTTAATGGAETRPRNIALLACIKY